MKAVLFNFETKKEREVALEDLSPVVRDQEFFWMTFRAEEKEDARAALHKLDADPIAIETFLGEPQEARYDFHEQAVLFSVTEAWFEEDGSLESGIIECMRGPNFLAVMQPEKSRVMEIIHRIYREDFQKFARSSGFLLYELASVLLETYRRSFQHVTSAVEDIQLKLFGEVTDEIFSEVSRLTANILAFRRMVFSSRDLFNELATRKSEFISASTQPTLKIIAGRMERLGDDLDSERSVMTETLNLYMGMVSHRTNRIINRLTLFSMIFLPLSFLCGVYGMNFDVMPELRWPFSYLVFWLVVVTFVCSFITLIWKKRWF